MHSALYQSLKPTDLAHSCNHLTLCVPCTVLPVPYLHLAPSSPRSPFPTTLPRHRPPRAPRVAWRYPNAFSFTTQFRLRRRRQAVELEAGDGWQRPVRSRKLQCPQLSHSSLHPLRIPPSLARSPGSTPWGSCAARNAVPDTLLRAARVRGLPREPCSLCPSSMRWPAPIGCPVRRSPLSSRARRCRVCPSAVSRRKRLLDTIRLSDTSMSHYIRSPHTATVVPF